MAFKIADGFVEVHGRVDKNDIRRAALQAGQHAGNTFSESMSRKIRQDIDRDFRNGALFSRLVAGVGGGDSMSIHGRRAGRSWLSGLADGILTPNPQIVSALRTGVPAILGSPMGIAGLAAGAAFAASFVSAVLSSAAIAGLGVGIMAGAAVAASQDQSVADAWKTSWAKISSSFVDSASDSMFEPIRESIELLGDDFEGRLAPRLKGIFAAVAPSVRSMTSGILDAVDEILAGIQRNISQIGSFLGPLSEQLPRLGHAVGAVFDTMLRNSGLVAAGFEDLVDVTVTLLDILDDTIIVGTRLWVTFNDIGYAIGGLTGLFAQFSRVANGQTDILTFLATTLGGLTGIYGLVRGAQENAGWATKDLTGNYEDFISVVDVGIGSLDEAARAAGGLAEALDWFNGRALEARAAERAFQEAIDEAQESLEEHGATLDIDTEAGRANQEALDAIATTARDAAAAVFEETKATEGMTAAKAAAIAKFQEGRQALIAAAIAMGLSADKAEELADEIMGIPQRWITEVEARTAVARREIRRVRDDLSAIDGDVANVYINVSTRYSPSASGVIGGNIASRYGNVFMARHGLIKMNTSQMFPPGGRTLFGFREPETGGEAFIARNAPRARSLSILDVAARWHRAVVVPMERAAMMAGNAVTSMSTAPAPQEITIPLTVELGGEVIDRRVIRILDERDRQRGIRIRAGTGTR